MKGLVPAICVLASGAFAQVSTYTAGSLGYPVPTPVNQTTAFAGFRTYDALMLREQELALAQPFISRHVIGASLQSRDITSLLFSDGDHLAPDGSPSGAVLINGTIHAREWASPEIVLRLSERLADNYGDQGIETYLVDALDIVMTTVSNPDGFIQTERTPSQYIGSADGRMRRKNMRNVDDDLFTTSDANQGVDVNRNFSQGWGNAGSTPGSETYYGTAAFSEPEAVAIANAVSLFDTPSRLRFYADMHGAIPAIYPIYSGPSANNSAVESVLDAMRATYYANNGITGTYQELPVFPGDEIGATDEYFGFTYHIPSYTIEYPTPLYRTGGFGPTFILPDAEVAEVVDENHDALLRAFAWAAGPPVLESVTIWRDANSDDLRQEGEVLHRSHWEAASGNPSARVRVVDTDEPLDLGAVLHVELQFNKPMRADNAGTPELWPGQSDALHPSAVVTLSNARRTTDVISATPVGDGWMATAASGETPGFRRYKHDTWMGTLDLTTLSGASAQNASLRVSATDTFGLALDNAPATAATYSSGWVGFEGGGGEDSITALSFAPVGGVAGWELY